MRSTRLRLPLWILCLFILAAPAMGEVAGAGGRGPGLTDVGLGTDVSRSPIGQRGPDDWSARISELERRVARGGARPGAADALFKEISADLEQKRTGVEEALRQRSPDSLARRAELHRIYRQRLRLLSHVSPGLRSRLFGAGPQGRAEFELELEIVRLDLGFQVLAIPRGVQAIIESFVEDPFLFLGRFAELIFAGILFRLWRRWAKRGMPRARLSVLAMRPRTELHLRFARLLWYVQRFRSPLEWLLLLYAASVLVDPGELSELATLVAVSVFWVLVTRFGFLVADSVFARDDGRNEERLVAIRQRSLRLVGVWFLVASLGLDLIGRYVGHAALYAWAWRTVILFTAPIFVILIVWWRDEIGRQIQSTAHESSVARWLRGRAGESLGFPVAVLAAFYLLALKLNRLVIRSAAHFELGRRGVAALLRREVERDGRESGDSWPPIPEELERALLTPDETKILGPYNDGLSRLDTHVEKGRGGTIVVLAERGGGSGQLLKLARERIGTGMHVIDCPEEGAASLRSTLEREFGIAEGDDLERELKVRVEEQGLRVVAFHEVHRVVRPCVGGLRGLEQIAGVMSCLGDEVLCLITITHEAWSYVSRMLGDRAVLHEVIRLPPWSEEQLERLIDGRCAQAGISPDYRELSFPRQYDESGSSTLVERNRAGYRRILWELSDGNPEVAIRLFADSLRERPGGRIVVRLPQQATSAALSSANLTTLLVLKVLMQTGVATVSDLERSIRERAEVIRGVLTACLQNEWVEQDRDRYEIAWPAYRRVKSTLIRRGLISR